MHLTKTLFALAITIGSTIAAAPRADACGSGEDDASVPVAVAHVPKYWYSPAAATAAIARLGDWKWPYGSAQYKDLEAYGAAAVPQLLAAIPAAHPYIRAVLLDLLGKARVAGTGVSLIAIADAMPEQPELAAVYVKAVEIDRTRAFDAIAARLAKSAVPSRVVALRAGFEVERAPALAWVVAQFPTTKDPVGLAEMAARLANANDKPTIAALLAATTDPRAKHRLAAKAIDLGVTGDAMFQILLAGLNSDVPAIRRDAFLQLSISAIPTADLRFDFLQALSYHQDDLRGDSYGAELPIALVRLGHYDRRVLERVFGGMTSSDPDQAMAAALAAKRYGAEVTPRYKHELIALVREALAHAGNTSSDKRRAYVLRRALAQLGG